MEYCLSSLLLAKFSVVRIVGQGRRQWHYRHWVAILKKIIKQHQVNLIFSFANPQVSNILGARLKKELGLKFIAHFSDPWHDNPFRSYSRRETKKILEQEKFIVDNSDGIVFTNQAAKDLVMKKYGLRLIKTAIIPHCYNPNDYPSVSKNPVNPFILSYVGAFYAQRNPEFIFEILSQLLRQNSRLAEKFTLQLVGYDTKYTDYSSQRVGDLVSQKGLNKIIELIPRVDYRASLTYIKSADCLLIIEADLRNSPFLPSKLIDYAGSGTPIIGLAPADSPTARFLRHLGYVCFDYQQADEMMDYLSRLINRSVTFKINKDFLKKFEVESTTAELIKFFSQVLAKP